MFGLGHVSSLSNRIAKFKCDLAILAFLIMSLLTS